MKKAEGELERLRPARARSGRCHPLECLEQCLLPTPHPKPGLLPVQDFIPTLHVEPEVRKGNRDGTVFPSNEVPGSVICHFLPLLSVLPAPLTLLIPGKVGAVSTRSSRRGEPGWGAPAAIRAPYMVCMFVLVRSKAQSTVAASNPDTRLHSMETFSLRRGRSIWSLCSPMLPAAQQPDAALSVNISLCCLSAVSTPVLHFVINTQVCSVTPGASLRPWASNRSACQFWSGRRPWSVHRAPPAQTRAYTQWRP